VPDPPIVEAAVPGPEAVDSTVAEAAEGSGPVAVGSIVAAAVPVAASAEEAVGVAGAVPSKAVDPEGLRQGDWVVGFRTRQDQTSQSPSSQPATEMVRRIPEQ